MKYKNNHSISLIDGLAEITRHHDRKMLEESVLKTISDLFQPESLHLFFLEGINERKLTKLIVVVDNKGNVYLEHDLPVNTISEKLSDSLSASAESKSIKLLENDEQTGWDIIYPILTVNNDVFSLLVCHCKKSPSLDEQQVVNGILHVYSNYLTLIDKTQRDKLTGLFNRETLDTEITKVLMQGSTEFTGIEIENEKRHSDDLTTWLGVVDIDHFKLINDTYGHLYGDEVIILVARLMMNSCVRGDDLVYRYGGEEFVVILKAVNEDNAMMAFDRLRQNIDKHEFPQVGNVAISIGFVQVMSQQSATDVIGMADDALYHAKKNGRNQTVSYKELLNQGKIVVTKHVNNSHVDLFDD
jgi:two-component system cell cycle response regulator